MNDLEHAVNELINPVQDFIEKLKLGVINLEEEAREYPARKARYNLALEQAKAKLARQKFKQKYVYYKLYKKHKEEAQAKGTKITEEGVKALIMTDSEYIKVSKEVLELEELVGKLQAAKEAVDDVGRMLYLLKESPDHRLGY